MLTKKKRVFILLGWMALLSAVYWGLGNTPLTLTVTYIYYVLCLLLSFAYLLVNGGIRPLLEQDREKEEKTREKYLADKGKMHPIKRRDKYRRFRIQPQEEQEAKPDREPLPPPPNPLHIPEEKRPLLSQILLLAVIPFYLIFMIDIVLLKFIA
jgi:hypothetical protein